MKEAVELIKKHKGNARAIFKEVGDPHRLKELMKYTPLMEIFVSYYSKHKKDPNRELVMKIIDEQLEEDLIGAELSSKILPRFKEMIRIHEEARRRYLFSFKSDPVASFIISKLKLKPLKAGVLGFILTLLIYFIGYAVYFLTGRQVAGITVMPLDTLYDFSLVPIVFGFYVWMSPKAGYLLLELMRRGVKPEDEEKFNDLVEAHVKNIVNHRAFPIISCAISLFLIAMVNYSALAFDTRWGPRESNFIIFCCLKVPILWGISWYMVFMIFFKAVATVFSIRRLLREPMLINIYHEDRQGGLKPLSDYVMTFSFFLAACGYAFILLFVKSWKYGYWHQDVIVDIGLIAYLFACFLFFFFTLQPAHNIILKSKLESRITGLLSPYRLEFMFKCAMVCLMPIIILIIGPFVIRLFNP